MHLADGSFCIASPEHQLTLEFTATAAGLPVTVVAGQTAATIFVPPMPVLSLVGSAGQLRMWQRCTSDKVTVGGTSGRPVTSLAVCGACKAAIYTPLYFRVLLSFLVYACCEPLSSVPT